MASILVIDDDRQFRRYLVQVLTREGHEVREAQDGFAGIESAKAHRPDLVIADILMPERDGLEVIRDVKRDSPDSKIIAISGGGSQVHVDFLPAAKKLGATAILYKPIEPEALLKCIEESLGA
jgi:CheY-like chemotaxis protein